MENEEEKKASGGKKNLPIIIVVVVVIAGAGAYMLFGRSKSAVPTGSVTVSEDSQAGESFTGTLKEAIRLGVGMKCTYMAEGQTFEGVIKGENYRGNMVTPEGKTATVIVKDDCMWTWEEGSAEGFTLCYEPTEIEDGETVEGGLGIWDQPDSVAGSEFEYDCDPAAVPDAQFNPPSNVDFLNPMEMVEEAGY